MNFNEFLENVASYIHEKMGDDVTVSIHTITKNNGVMLSGLCLRDKKLNAAPTIYMEHYYNQYLRGEDIASISDNIISVYMLNALQEDFEIEEFTDFEKVRNKLYLKIVNYEKNQLMLENTPSERYYDLALIPYCYISNHKFGNASITVKEEHLKLWGKDAAEVIDIARQNTRENMECDCKPLVDLLISSFEEMKGYLSDAGEYLDVPMYVVTNKIRMNGAVFMADRRKLSEFAQMLGGDYYILPSSVHELILLPATGEEDYKYLDSMICEINDTEVAPEEVLSDHAYLYSYDEEVLKF